jgi:hypothetical protein
MKIKTLLLTAAAAAILSNTGALADRDRDRDGRPDHSWAERHDRDGFNDRGRDRDHDGRPDNSWGERHDRDGYRDDWRGRQAWHWRDDRGGWHGDRDRYWRQGYRGYLSGDIYYRTLRSHGYHRWDGAPYWYQGRYVVRTYDRWGRVVFVEMNPYTGGFVGVVRF